MELIIEKQKSQAQEVLIYQLLQSKWLVKKEHAELTRLASEGIATSSDATKLISHLLALIKFRQCFYSERRRARKYCCVCGRRGELNKHSEIATGKARYYCDICERDLLEEVPVIEQGLLAYSTINKNGGNGK